MALLLGLAPLTLTGCVEGPLSAGGFIEFFLRGIGVGGRPIAAGVTRAFARTPKVEESIAVQFTGSIGGLSGTFEVTVGSYGTLTGTTTIKGRKKAVLTATDDPQVAALVEAMVLDVTGAQVDVTESKTVFSGRQTTGGVKKIYKGRVAWKGAVVAGPDAGTPVKGRLRTKGSFE
jgi:hypothetical protein